MYRNDNQKLIYLIKYKYLIVRSLFLILILLFNSLVFAQIDADSLMGLPRASTTERNAVTGVEIGSLVYDTTLNRVFQYTNTGWLELLTTQNIYVGSFLITSANNATDVEVTGLPFQPTSITFKAHANIESANINTDNGTQPNDPGIRNSFATMDGFARDNNGASTTQQVISVGSHGNSINDISRYASPNHCIGIRYGDQNGNPLGRILGSLVSFDPTGFTIDVTYQNGNQNYNNNRGNVRPTDINNEGLLVLFTAYR